MNIEKLLKDYNIPFVTPGEHSHCTANSVNVHCPFCPGSADYHLGISTLGQGCNCWRCGGHGLIETLSAVLSKSHGEVYQILKDYDGVQSRRKPEEAKVAIHPLKFPSPNFPLKKSGRNYLSGRGFDPEKLEQEWGILQTDVVSFLDGINYGRRILIPIKWNDKVVSFQTRDITEEAAMRYITCPKKRERVHHKNIVYGKQEMWEDFPALIVVEGITDVWRFGPAAVATFGIEFKREQVMALAKVHDKFIVIFDNEPQAQKQARKLAVKLKALGKLATIETISGKDPGGMKQEDADHLVKELLL